MLWFILPLSSAAKLYVVLVILVGAGWLAQMAFTVGYSLGARDTQLEIIKLNAPNSIKQPERDSSFDFLLFLHRVSLRISPYFADSH